MSASATLIMPGLCGPLPEHARGLQLDGVTELAELLGSRASDDRSSYLEILAGCLGSEHLPVAGLSLFATDESCRTKYCMLIEPVHLKADMDHALMIDRSLLGITDAERARLRQELNAHFHEDGIDIIEDQHGDWYITSDEPFGIETTPVAQVIARNVNLFMPGGDQALRWKRFMNESQMLLFQSEVNQHREASGLMSVNSLWPVADDVRIDDLDIATTHYDLIAGDCALHRGIASLLSVAYLPLDELDGSSVPEGNMLLCDTSMMYACASGDTVRWSDLLRERIDAMLRPWIELARRGMLELELLPCASKRYAIRRRGLFDRFIRPNPTEVICYGD